MTKKKTPEEAFREWKDQQNSLGYDPTSNSLGAWNARGEYDAEIIKELEERLQEAIEGREKILKEATPFFEVLRDRNKAWQENERLRAKLKASEKPETTVEQIEAALEQMGIHELKMLVETTRKSFAEHLHAALYPKPNPERKWHPCQSNGGEPCAWWRIEAGSHLNYQRKSWRLCPGCGSPLWD